MKEGKLKIYPELIYQKFPLKEIDKAFDLFKDDKKPGGKVLILSKK
jgi:threonine dehydrogenase-like Zn-dependent dehydrogenase